MMMTDAQVAAQIARADRFREEVRELIAATTTDSASPCADYHRSGLRRIADTLDVVPYVTFANLSNINTALRGMLLELIEVHLLAVGGGPTLDHVDAAAFFAQFQPLIDVGLRRYRQ
jgi:hypothetical protein